MVNTVPVYVINIPCELRRYTSFMDKTGKFYTDLTRIDPPTLHSREVTNIVRTFAVKSVKTSREISNKLSFVLALEDALRKKHRNIVIFEDDAVPAVEDAPKQVENLIRLLPEDYSICYLGGYIRPYKTLNIKGIESEFLQLGNDKDRHKVWGAHAILYNIRVYEHLIKAFRAKSKILTDTYLHSSLPDEYKRFFSRTVLYWQDREGVSKCNHGTSLHGPVFNFRKMEKDTEKFLTDVCRKNVVKISP